MTEREYLIGQWYPHDGGPRPVPEGTMCNFLTKGGLKTQSPSANWDWYNIVAFCVTEYPDEEETRTHRCHVEKLQPMTFPRFVNNVGDVGSDEGFCTVTIVNGKPKRIVWDADE
jgi:hypothetical protein